MSSNDHYLKWKNTFNNELLSYKLNPPKLTMKILILPK